MREALLVMDKVPGPTSFDVVRQVRRSLGGEKVGHSGSLDPFASGVLVLLVGRATKLSNLLLNADKRYQAKIKLGESTDTMDLTGTVTESLAVPPVTFSQVDEVVQGFQGTWHQVPPMYSAKKINGVRLYELARKNIEVTREAIAVELYEMRTLSYEAPFLNIEVHCSKGTYIRSLADDIGRKLGTLGHLHELRRLSCGGFSLEDSVTVEAFQKEQAMWLEQGYRHYNRLLRAEGLFRTTVPRPSVNLASRY